MDIFSPRGIQAREDEVKMLNSLRLMYKSQGKNVVLAESHKDKPAKIDGVIVEDGVITGIYESKCRYINRAKLRDYGNTLLIGNDKIEAGAKMSAYLSAPFYLLTYLVNEPICLMIQITDDKGNKLFDFEVNETQTKANINGGTAIRDNAFIDIKNAFEFPIIN